jgi:hypothetical protein
LNPGYTNQVTMIDAARLDKPVGHCADGVSWGHSAVAQTAPTVKTVCAKPAIITLAIERCTIVPSLMLDLIEEWVFEPFLLSMHTTFSVYLERPLRCSLRRLVNF